MKNYISIFLLIVIIIFVTFFLFSCKTENNNFATNGGNKVLNSRQIEILEEMGLPIEYDSLNLLQQRSIDSIEEMLTVLEDKYPNEQFSYIGYVPNYGGEREKLIAECKHGDVVEYRDYDGSKSIFTDNYLEVSLSPEYEEIIRKNIQTQCKEDDCKVFSKIDEFVDYYDGNNLLSVCSSSSYIYFSENIGTDKFNDIISNFSDWISKETSNVDVFVKFFLVKGNNINRINKYNFIEENKKDIFIDVKMLVIYKNGYKTIE